jgi:hypothetical protein
MSGFDGLTEATSNCGSAAGWPPLDWPINEEAEKREATTAAHRYVLETQQALALLLGGISDDYDIPDLPSALNHEMKSCGSISKMGSGYGPDGAHRLIARLG